MHDRQAHKVFGQNTVVMQILTRLHFSKKTAHIHNRQKMDMDRSSEMKTELTLK